MGPKRRFIYLGLLAVTGAWFVIDRLTGGEPERAAAETRPVSRMPGKSHPASLEQKASPTADGALLWLNELQDVQTDRDAFSPTMLMLQHYQMLQQAEEEQARDHRSGPEPGSPEDFTQRHTLDGTFISEGTLLAVIDGKVRRLGDRIEGYRLTRIESYRAELRRGRDRVVLAIEMPMGLEAAPVEETGETNAEPQETHAEPSRLREAWTGLKERIGL